MWSGLRTLTSFVLFAFTNDEYGLLFRCDFLLLQFHSNHLRLLASVCYASLGSVSLQLVCFLSFFFLLHLISFCFAFPRIPGIPEILEIPEIPGFLGILGFMGFLGFLGFLGIVDFHDRGSLEMPSFQDTLDSKSCDSGYLGILVNQEIGSHTPDRRISKNLSPKPNWGRPHWGNSNF